MALLLIPLCLLCMCLLCTVLVLSWSYAKNGRRGTGVRVWNKALLIGFVVVPIVLVAGEILRIVIYVSLYPAPEPTEWEGWAVNKQHHAEGNFAKVGNFASKEQCVEATKKAAPLKEIRLSNFPEAGVLRADFYMCGRGCLAPDGPGDISFSEYECVESESEAIGP